jgi:uncharacterized protein (DUF1015 family)
MPQIAGLRAILPKPGLTPSQFTEHIAAMIERGPQQAWPQALAGDVLARDATRAVYRYHQVFPGPGRQLTRKSVFCAVQLTSYRDNQIRPHELASPAGREAALATIRGLATHVAPVLLGFRDPSTEVERLCRKVESSKPILELTTADATVHRLWRIQDAETIGGLRRYFAPKKLHLLDGHDRYEAMLAYRDELVAASSAAVTMYAAANFGLACLTSLDDPALATAPRHRVIRGGGSRDAVLAALGNRFIVDKLAGAAGELGKQLAALADTVAHQPALVAVFAGEPDAWKLTLSPEVSPVAEGVQIDRALQRLDPVVIQHLVIERGFAGAQITTETNAELALAALGHGADAVLVTRPLSVEQIAHVDELGAMLPSGSTAFYPPIAPGLVGMPIDRDEELV